MKELSNARAVRVINRVIIACFDGASAFDEGARAMRDPTERAMLTGRAWHLRGAIPGLRRTVRSLGGVPAGRRSARAAFSEFTGTMRSFLAGTRHTGDAYAQCVHFGARVQDAYAHALAERLPDDARAGMERQSTAIDEDAVEFRRRRGRS